MIIVIVYICGFFVVVVYLLYCFLCFGCEPSLTVSWIFAVVFFISFYFVGVLFCFLEFGWFCYFIGLLICYFIVCFFGGKNLQLGVLGSLT